MKKLLNPIEFYNDRKLLIVNLIIFVVGTALTVLLRGVFGSPIDLHFESEIVLLHSVLGNITAVLTMMLVLFIAGKIINRKTRLIDCLNLALYIRIPYYVLTLWNILGTFSKMKPVVDNQNKISVTLPSSTIDVLVLSSFSFFALVALVIIGTIVYFGFKTITNSKKVTDYLILIVLIIISIILSYTLSKNF